MAITWTNETRKLSDLQPWPRNPRQIRQKQAERLIDSVDTFGQVETLAVGPNGEVYNGHQRLQVLMQEHGADFEVDVRVASRPLTEKEREKLTVYLHKGAAGEWDFDTLANEFEVDELLDWGFEAFELGIDELDDTNAGADTEPEIDRAEELRQKWGVEPGQLWQLGDHRMICGDCTDAEVVARVMGGEPVECVVSDPPYGGNYDVNYTRFSGGITQSKNFGNGIVGDDKPFNPSPWLNSKEVILWGAHLYAARLPVGSWLVWDKRYDGKEKILSDGEIGWHNKGMGVYIFNHGWNGFMRESERGKTVHPTQKPSALMEWCIGKTESIVILDPFCGSGTTIIACENLGRKCRAVEISPAYVGVALERWAQHTGRTPELIDG